MAMKLTLGKKLGLGFAAILCLLVFSSTLSYLKSAAVQRDMDVSFDLRFPSTLAATDLQRDLNMTSLKARQAILAGTDPSRRDAAQKGWGEAWDAIAADVAKLDTLAPAWVLQANRDRLARIKDELATLHDTQKSTMDMSAGEADAVIKAGNEYNDRATPAANDVRETLQAMADAFDNLLVKKKDEVHAENRSLHLSIAVSTFLGLAIGIFVSIFLSRSIAGNTQSILRQTQAIASGDLTGAKLKVQSQDELGEITQAVNEMQSRLFQIIESIRGTAEQVAATSTELSATSQQITANSEETTAQANVVSEAGGQVNTNLQTLASGAEEMNSTIGEIARNATDAARVSGEAVVAADAANATVSKLGDSSAEIEKVIEAITTIAQQTNLLALNATIEAARAGEAGKGFAVVANEVKELAKQTARATDEIKKKIGVIRENTGGAVEAIIGIKGVIDQVSQISTTIATAVEEQSATTSEMTRNVMEAARGATTIADNIKGVAEAAQNTSNNVGEAQTATEHLARMANQLRDLVGHFKVGRGARPTEPKTPIKAARKVAGAH